MISKFDKFIREHLNFNRDDVTVCMAIENSDDV